MYNLTVVLSRVAINTIYTTPTLQMKWKLQQNETDGEFYWLFTIVGHVICFPVDYQQQLSMIHSLLLELTIAFFIPTVNYVDNWNRGVFNFT